MLAYGKIVRERSVLRQLIEPQIKLRTRPLPLMAVIPIPCWAGRTVRIQIAENRLKAAVEKVALC